MEEIAGVQYHVDIMLFRQTHHFVERLPAVILAMRIALVVADMAVCGD
jgi:hypothetical protein